MWAGDDLACLTSEDSLHWGVDGPRHPPAQGLKQAGYSPRHPHPSQDSLFLPLLSSSACTLSHLSMNFWNTSPRRF